jgi:hypothetical protein
MTKTITVIQEIEVTVDESRFTAEFMENFSRYFHGLESIEEHMQFIAKCRARGFVVSSSEFLEGYGKLSDFGISFGNVNVYVSEPE